MSYLIECWRLRRKIQDRLDLPPLILLRTQPKAAARVPGRRERQCPVWRDPIANNLGYYRKASRSALNGESLKGCLQPLSAVQVRESGER
jgi:hypothetical protein